VQVWAAGELKSLSEIRDVVRRSSSVLRYEPGDAKAWAAAAERLGQL
jgi:hypothetical protein